MAISEVEREKRKEEHKAYANWVDEQIADWEATVRPYYSAKGLDSVKYKMTEGLKRGSGNFDFVYGGRVYYAGSPALGNDNIEKKKAAVTEFLSDIASMLKGLSTGDYDSAREAYNRQLGDFGSQDQSSINGVNFICQQIIPGSKCEGFVEVVKDEVKETYESKMADKQLDWCTPDEKQEIANEACLKVISEVQSTEARNKVQVMLEEKGNEILKGYLGSMPSKQASSEQQENAGPQND